jgi:hypothetical protein
MEAERESAVYVSLSAHDRYLNDSFRNFPWALRKLGFRLSIAHRGVFVLGIAGHRACSIEEQMPIETQDNLCY